MNEKKAKEQKPMNDVKYAIGHQQAVYILTFLKDLDIPSKALKNSINILSTIQPIQDSLDKTYFENIQSEDSGDEKDEKES